MPVNKNAMIRYTVLDKCFRNTGRRYSIDDLVGECSKVLLEINPESRGITRRQIYSDIAYMESSEGWEVELEKVREDRRVYFRYSDPNYSITNMPLNEIEIEQLRTILGMLGQFKGLPQLEGLEDLIYRLNNSLKFDKETAPIISFDANQYLKGVELLGDFYNAIHYRKVLKIQYQPFQSQEEYNWTIHPYYLKQYNNRWFVFCKCLQNDYAITNLALDRINTLKETTDNYIDCAIDWQEYFDDFIGVSRPEGSEVEEVILHFREKQSFYVHTKPIHHSQKSRWIDDNTLEVKLRLIINYEFENLLMNYIEDMKVIKPERLRRSLIERLQKALSFNH